MKLEKIKVIGKYKTAITRKAVTIISLFMNRHYSPFFPLQTPGVALKLTYISYL